MATLPRHDNREPQRAECCQGEYGRRDLPRRHERNSLADARVDDFIEFSP